MEFVATKWHKKWKKKRYLKRKRLQERIRIEVNSAKHWKVFPEDINPFDARKILGTSTMQADTFWKNYMIAQEWQKRHSITWWRSRCLALEYENEMLRNKVRLLAQQPNTVIAQENNHKENNDNNAQEEKLCKKKSYMRLNPDSEDVELNVTEDMLNFFEISERHRRQLKQKRKSKKIVHEEDLEEIPITDNTECVRTRKEEADLLYGDDSSKILAMETALQAAMNKYKDTVNPQYWPNIPIKF